MTTDNAKPAVITAAEFVAGGYAERIAAGECKVFALTWSVKTLERQDGVWFYVFQSSGDGHEYPYLQFDTDTPPLLEVYDTATASGGTVAASSTDADEVARLRAEVARLREALGDVIKSADNASKRANSLPQNQDLYSKAVAWEYAARIARAALETGEAGE